jgi:sugar/nucleoside kinase (ribokinase family)
VLCTIGDLLEDVLVVLDRPPARGTDTPARITRSRGGSAANVAAAAAAAGVAVRFVGRVGDDALGGQLVNELAGRGVDVRVQRAGRTGSVVVLVEPGGERTMLPDRGAAVELGPVEPAWLAGVTWLHVPAYSLCAEPIGTHTVAAVSAVRRAGGRLSVDVSSVAVVEAFGSSRFAELVGALAPDMLFANADEAALLGDVGRVELVVKRGADPVLITHVDGTSDEVAVDPVPGVVDTTGAGDAFAAGYLAAVLGGASRVEAAAAGSRLAARTLGGAGAAPE